VFNVANDKKSDWEQRLINRKLGMIIGLQAFLIVMLFWVLVFYGKDEYEASSQVSTDKIATPNRISNKAGNTIITVNTATQAQSDIKTSTLKAGTHQATIDSYGNVISIDSLIDLRTRYLSSKAEAEVLRTTLTHFKSEYNRLHALNMDDKNISDRAVAAALVDIKSNEAKVFSAELNATNLAGSMQQAWGEGLAQLALSKDTSQLLQNLIDYKEVLIQITLPFDSPEPSQKSSISVTPSLASSHTLNAQYISRAPASSATIQGKTYFYHAKSPELRAGMQVKVLSSQNKGSITGVIIPSTAVIWYGGKPWVYRKLGADQFSRLPINTEVELENGWFYTGKLTPNDAVVTSGAQLLLSEEFKSQITNENQD
jgi:hypothetical protein